MPAFSPFFCLYVQNVGIVLIITISNLLRLRIFYSFYYSICQDRSKDSTRQPTCGNKQQQTTMKTTISLWFILFSLFMLLLIQTSAAFSNLRGKSREVVKYSDIIKDSTLLQSNEVLVVGPNNISEIVSVSSQERRETINENERKEEEDSRKLGGEAVQRLFSTPLAQWTLAQWGLLLVLLWLVGHFLRRCPCIYDMIACYCCYELFCDPDPTSFVPC